jgi:hypothetical protein
MFEHCQDLHREGREKRFVVRACTEGPTEQLRCPQADHRRGRDSTWTPTIALGLQLLRLVLHPAHREPQRARDLEQ